MTSATSRLTKAYKAKYRAKSKTFQPSGLISSLPGSLCWIDWVRSTQTCGNFWATNENPTLKSKLTYHRPNVDEQGVNWWLCIPLIVVWGQSLQCLFQTNHQYLTICQPRPSKNLSLKGRGKPGHLTSPWSLSTWQVEVEIQNNLKGGVHALFGPWLQPMLKSGSDWIRRCLSRYPLKGCDTLQLWAALFFQSNVTRAIKKPFSMVKQRKRSQWICFLCYCKLRANGGDVCKHNRQQPRWRSLSANGGTRADFQDSARSLRKHPVNVSSTLYQMEHQEYR